MLQSFYTLSDLIDLALIIPEVGAVNFNILHTILHIIVKELDITDVRAYCHIENPIFAKTELTRAKLKKAVHKKELESSEDVYVVSTEHPVSTTSENVEEKISKSKEEETTRQVASQEPSKETPEGISSPEQTQPPSTASNTGIQTEEVDSIDREIASPGVEKEESTPKEAAVAETEEHSAEKEQPEAPAKKKTTPKHVKKHHEGNEEETARQVALQEPSKETPEGISSQEQAQPSSTASSTGMQTEEVDSIDREIASPGVEKEESTLREAAVAETEKHSAEKEQPEAPAKKKTAPKHVKKHHEGDDFRKFENLESRVEAVEETLQNVSDIVDMIVNKMMKGDEKKKTDGVKSVKSVTIERSAAEEFESMDERLLEVEEALARFAADHDLLLEIDDNMRKLMEEFEKMKALASLLEQMQLDISKKADKEETWAALALKGDLELLNTKVDRLEFETAIEELGEAIGLLSLKFTRKNDEWEERAAEIWRGIDSKMTRDIFEAARIKIEARLKALMYGLRKLKKVVEDLLYPESSGVTRCILCRRPACISGLECLGLSDSPKRRLSDKSSEDEDPNLREAINAAIAKRQKLEAPPYSKVHDTIITIPYSSSSYRTSIDEKKEVPQMKLKPINVIKDSTNKKGSQIPKLPAINNTESSHSSVRRQSAVSRKTRNKSRNQKAELVFTRKMLENLERSEGKIAPPEKHRYTGVLEVESPKSVSSRQSSIKSSTDMTPDPDKTLDAFTPARLMTDPLRKDILVSQTSPKEHELNMTLSPMQFDTESIKRLSTKNSEKQGSETTVSPPVSSDESEMSMHT